MKWLGKLFKRKKKSYSTDGQYKLLIIDESKELFHEIMGITDERADDLLKFSRKAFDGNDSMHKGLEELISLCTHTNEIVFATMLYHKMLERELSRQRLFGTMNDLFNNKK
jgi:hypothetical protein